MAEIIMETTPLQVPASIAQKLELVAVDVQEMAPDVLSEPATPTGVAKTFDFGASLSSRQSSTQIRRTSSRMSHRSSSHMHGHHHHTMSSEFAAQAESKFLSLMEFMACASREASMLKEYWYKFTSERESWIIEREELCEKVTHVTTELEKRRNERSRVDIEIIEKNKKIELLTLELSAALACVSAEKKKVIECEHELKHTREEVHEIKETLSRTQIDYEETRTELETSETCLKTAITERDCARADAEKHHKELQKCTRERNEIHSKLCEMTTKFESSRKEVCSLTERIRVFEQEREEYLLDCDRLRDEARRCKSKYDESCKQLTEIHEKYERLTREMHKIKETLKIVETERDEYCHTIDTLRRECKAIACDRDEAEERCSDMTLKYEHVKRELTSTKTRLREVEIERTETLELLEKVRDEMRVIICERDEVKDDLHHCHIKLEECQRQIVTLTETLHKTEHHLSESRTEVHTLNERIRRIECERDESRHECVHLKTEITELHAQILLLQAEIRTVTESREKLRIEYERIEREYREMITIIDCHKDSTHELECEIDNLRHMFEEAKAQREVAIAARCTADSERDVYCQKYEEKCREFERFEQNCSQHHHHGHGHGHGRHGGHSDRVVIMKTGESASSSEEIQTSETGSEN